MDSIHLDQIKSFCRLGIFDEERASGQEILIDLEMKVDIRKACKSDDIADTVNYAEVSSAIQKKAQAKEYYLVEHLAEELANCVFDCSKLVEALTIKVYKPVINAEGFSGNVSVTIQRQK